MNALYLDTSTLIALYVLESHSETTQAVISTHENLLVSDLAHLEFYSAMALKQRTGAISNEAQLATTALFEKHLQEGHYQQIALSKPMYHLAQTYLANPAIALKTLDALHLAAATTLKATLFTADRQLGFAAQKLKISHLLPL